MADDGNGEKKQSGEDDQHERECNLRGNKSGAEAKMTLRDAGGDAGFEGAVGIAA